MALGWEPTALLVVMTVVFAGRGLGVAVGFVADALALGSGAATALGPVDLAWTTATAWLAIAVVAGDHVAQAAGRPSGRDPWGLLRLSRTTFGYAVGSATGAALWSLGLVLAGRVLAGLGDAVEVPWLVVLVLLVGAAHPVPVDRSSR